MIFLPAIRDRRQRLEGRDLPLARADTAIGAVATQMIMIAIVITTAATLFVHHQQVEDAAHAALALVPLTGSHWAGVAFGAGLLGAAMIGALVVSLATAWAFGEAFRWPCSLNFNCTEAKRFYGLYAAMVVVSAGVVLIPHLPLIKITVYVEAFNAFVLPIVLGFLLVLVERQTDLGRPRQLVARQHDRAGRFGRVRRARSLDGRPYLHRTRRRVAHIEFARRRRRAAWAKPKRNGLRVTQS